ncbi:ATP-dependent RNA helicase dbp10 [Lecanora helva]
MPHKAFSPAASDNEVDIASALFNDGSNLESDDETQIQHPDRRARMLSPTEMPDLGGDHSSDDAGFIAEAQATSNRKAANLKGKTVKKGGGFQAMGLNASLLKAITRKGFSVPTPIQRKTIPLILDGQDVVGMARTGSGKTAAFVVPMIEKLKCHSPKVGARGLILSPSRELALQTLKVVKELGRATDLRCILLVGGESLEDQFSDMAGNPDIIIATPGRFLHLKVEMQLDLSSMRYVVFDEADRLFEMGFASQLTEILHALPQTRQTLLWSATLPSSLIEFARAGLQEPHLVRLDAESKISPDLESVFFSVKSQEKEGALLHVINDVIKIPTGKTDATLRAKGDMGSKKRKRDDVDGTKAKGSPTEYSTIIFAATRHHVDYLSTLLRRSGFAVSHAYGSLDQTARKIQVSDFTTGMTHILVVTDVAARGIDIPVLANVINYDFPPQPKIFVHRLFLGKRLIIGQNGADPKYTEDVVFGTTVQDKLQSNCEWVSKLLDEDSDLSSLRSVAMRGEKLYLRTRNAASVESARRSKEIIASKSPSSLHPLFSNENNDAETERANMLARVSGFRPQESVFEIGKRGTGGEAAEIMKKRRAALEIQRKNKAEAHQADTEEPLDIRDSEQAQRTRSMSPDKTALSDDGLDIVPPSDDELEITVSQSAPTGRGKSDNFQQSDFFMSYTPSTTNLAEDRGYGVHSGGSSFISAARSAAMDLTNDDGAKAFAEPSRAKGMRWDKKSKKYVARANDEDGTRGKKLVKSESGQKIAASFRSGRFDNWKKSNRIGRLPRNGENETAANVTSRDGKRFRHRADKAPKDADKCRDDFYKRKKMVDRAKEERRGRFRDGRGKSEIKGIDDVRKERGMKERRKQKNARPRRTR